MSNYALNHFIVAWNFPTDNANSKRQGRHFRKALLEVGASVMGGRTIGRQGAALVQSMTAEKAAEKVAKLKTKLPADALMNVIFISEVQLVKSQNFWGRMRKPGQKTMAGV